MTPQKLLGSMEFGKKSWAIDRLFIGITKIGKLYPKEGIINRRVESTR
jgi:hypothetical protein